MGSRHQAPLLDRLSALGALGHGSGSWASAPVWPGPDAVEPSVLPPRSEPQPSAESASELQQRTILAFPCDLLLRSLWIPRVSLTPDLDVGTCVTLHAYALDSRSFLSLSIAQGVSQDGDPGIQGASRDSQPHDLQLPPASSFSGLHDPSPDPQLLGRASTTSAFAKSFPRVRQLPGALSASNTLSSLRQMSLCPGSGGQ